jgi:putative ABC transport system permease protein
MLKNYFKISLRSLMKNPLNSFINVFGLAAAIGICIFAYAFARWTYSTDQFHEHKNTVYLTTFFADRDGTQQQYGLAPVPLAEMMRQDFAQIKKVCRVEDRNVVVKYQDRVFHERVRFTDPEFLEIFTFPLKWGIANSLSDGNSIILSEDMSVKYFGEENPIGQTILVKFDQDRSKAFKITGVGKEFPKAITIAFDFLINAENLRYAEAGFNINNWNTFVKATFIQVDNPSDLISIGKGMDKYRKLQNEVVNTDWAITSFAFEPLATLHERSGEIKDDISRSSDDKYKSIMYLSIISVLLMALACFNYINIAIVTAAKRFKEIGIRKSIGATRGILIVQFLLENITIIFIALFLGLLLAMFFFIPGFESMWHFNMGFKLNDANLWIYLPAILLLTSIASGIFPSLYISKFQVIGILKGSVQFGKRNPLTKILLGFQLILSCIFITSAVMFTQNTNFLAQRSWGYSQADALYAVVPNLAGFEKLSARMAQHPDVLSISGSAHHLGKSHDLAVLHFPDREYEVDQLPVDAKYFETMGLKLKEGRIFNDHQGSDRYAGVVNELLVENMGWTNSIGQTFRIDSAEYTIVGVLKEFHHLSFSNVVRPMIFTVADKENFKYLSLKVGSGAEIKTYKALQSTWAALFPETPFEGGLQQDVWGNFFESIKIHRSVWTVFAIIAVLLAGLGLYGLMTLNVAGRVKEFSIRKVLGAGINNLVTLIIKQYALLFTVALIIGAPVSHILIKLLLEASYVYHMPITYSGVAFASGALILVLLITVSTQINNVSKSNPVDGLKVE